LFYALAAMVTNEKIEMVAKVSQILISNQ